MFADAVQHGLGWHNDAIVARERSACQQRVPKDYGFHRDMMHSYLMADAAKITIIYSGMKDNGKELKDRDKYLPGTFADVEKYNYMLWDLKQRLPDFEPWDPQKPILFIKAGDAPYKDAEDAGDSQRPALPGGTGRD